MKFLWKNTAILVNSRYTELSNVHFQIFFFVNIDDVAQITSKIIWKNNISKIKFK